MHPFFSLWQSCSPQAGATGCTFRPFDNLNQKRIPDALEQDFQGSAAATPAAFFLKKAGDMQPPAKAAGSQQQAQNQMMK